MKYLILLITLLSCASTSECVLADRHEDNDSLILVFNCPGRTKICRVVGFKRRDCRTYLIGN
jgi:hypothetical protein